MARQLTNNNSFVSPIADLPETSRDVVGDVRMMPTAKIKVSAEQARTVFDEVELAGLAESMKDHGILQPLIVRSNGMLVAGERRLRASKIAGLVQVPVIVRDVEDSKESYLLGLIENVQRANLRPMEEATAYAKLNSDYSMTHEQIAAKLGKSRVYITKMISLLNLPEDVQELVRTGKIDWSKALELKSASDETIEEITTAAQDLTKSEVNKLVTVKTAKVTYTGTQEEPKCATIADVQAVIYRELNRNATGSIYTRIAWLKANSDIARYSAICIKAIDPMIFDAAYSNVLTQLENVKEIAQRDAQARKQAFAPSVKSDLVPDWAKDAEIDIPLAQAQKQADNSALVVNCVDGGFNAPATVEKFEVDVLAEFRRALRRIAYYKLGDENGADIRNDPHVAELIAIASEVLEVEI